MSLAFTAPTKANMFEFIQERLWYKFEDRSEEWDAWVAANDGNAFTETMSSRAVTILINTGFIEAWSAVTATVGFVKKWTGACLRDYSSGVGGFCIFETNDTDMTGTSDTVELIYSVIANGDTTTVVGESTNRSTEFYRLSASDFDAMEDAWSTMTIVDTNTNMQDGRCYYNIITDAG